MRFRKYYTLTAAGRANMWRIRFDDDVIGWILYCFAWAPGDGTDGLTEETIGIELTKNMRTMLPNPWHQALVVRLGLIRAQLHGHLAEMVSQGLLSYD
jgi:hypothetical protein